jgi:hypothetical protein
MKLFVPYKFALIFILISCASIIEADASNYPQRGYIQNDSGKKCWYTQKTDGNNKYFHGMKNTVGIITFDDPQCMSASEIGLMVNKMMINNVITRWYSHPDANFQTRESALYPSSLFQKKGKCIQSKKYSGVGVTVDYFIRNNSITGVIHGLAIQGCTK